ncbi:serine hydrolase [uncultured Tenacibaculum sp.]|uniref:serine hydrolase n=1 Tax=uncultured Tenacibaculum sp. TaxID=174713 RepID=UPI00263138D8|nr:serine hydrolase [uncultured Tenacibaculum sp.]
MKRLIKKQTLLCLLLFGLIVNGYSQSQKKEIEDAMQKFVALDQFSGTVLLAKEGKILYAKAFGEANKEFNNKNNLDTKFDICSMGKMFTGVAIMQLEEQGKLNVNDPVSKYLKEFPFGDKITIHHLLSHTSGTGNYFRHPDYRLKNNTLREVDEMLPLVYDQKLVFKEPGERFSYSNSGIVILGAIIEEITGEKYADYITNNILSPLGMHNTGIKYLDDVVENRATGYIKSIAGKFNKNTFIIPTANPSGGILSTVNDLLKFDQALYTDKLINDSSKEKMFTAIKSRYGYTFQVDNRYDNKIVGHGGGAPGFTSNFSRYLKDKYVIIVLSNYDRIAREVAQTIEAIIYKREYRFPRKKLPNYVYDNQQKLASFKTIKDIASFLEKKDYKPRFGGVLNYAGYETMEEGNIDYAITIFKLNVYFFPNIPQVYNSLAEAYETNKQYDLALENYKKAVDVAENKKHPLLNSLKKSLKEFQEKNLLK